MKCDMFWRVVAIVLLILLALWIYEERFYYLGQFRADKFTGAVYMLDNGRWVRQ